MTELDPSTLLIMVPLLITAILVALWWGSGTVTRRWNRHRAETVSKWEAEGVQFERGPRGGQFGGLESMGATEWCGGLDLWRSPTMICG